MHVDFLSNRTDLTVLAMGQLGFSTEYIAAMTGLTGGQVLYRLRRGSVRRGAYRNGESSSARIVLMQTERALCRAIVARLRNGTKRLGG